MGGLPVYMLGYTPRQTPPGQTPTWADAPRETPPPRDTMGYGQLAGGTHLPGMHTCFRQLSAAFHCVGGANKSVAHQV